MKKSIYIIGIILLCLFGILRYSSASENEYPQLKKGGDKEKAESPVHFDGIYFKNGILKAGHHQAKNYTYLRFYEDGTVVSFISASSPERIAKYISKSKNTGKGKYNIKDNYIDFSMKEINERHSYEGEILGDTLKMNIYSSGMDGMYQDYFFYLPVEFKTK